MIGIHKTRCIYTSPFWLIRHIWWYFFANVPVKVTPVIIRSKHALVNDGGFGVKYNLSTNLVLLEVHKDMKNCHSSLVLAWCWKNCNSSTNIPMQPSSMAHEWLFQWVAKTTRLAHHVIWESHPVLVYNHFGKSVVRLFSMLSPGHLPQEEGPPWPPYWHWICFPWTIPLYCWVVVPFPYLHRDKCLAISRSLAFICTVCPGCS